MLGYQKHFDQHWRQIIAAGCGNCTLIKQRSRSEKPRNAAPNKWVKRKLIEQRNSSYKLHLQVEFKLPAEVLFTDFSLLTSFTKCKPNLHWSKEFNKNNYKTPSCFVSWQRGKHTTKHLTLMAQNGWTLIQTLVITDLLCHFQVLSGNCLITTHLTPLNTIIFPVIFQC